MKEKILITGGAGYIGSRLANKLVQLKYQVIVIDNLSAGKRSNLSPLVTFYELDIRSPRIADVFASEKPSIVFHLAASKSVNDSIKHRKMFESINIAGSKNIIDTSSKYGVKKFIFTSTAGVYGDAINNHLQSELDTPYPSSPYAETKFATEKYLSGIKNLDTTIFRFANVYGPGGDTTYKSVINIFIEKFLNNEELEIHGDGTQSRDFIYTDDLIEACLKVLAAKSSKKTIRTINLSSAISITINDLIKVIAKKLKATPNIKHFPSTYHGQNTSILSNSLAKKILGWKPRVTLLAGIRNTIKHISIPKPSLTVGIPAYNECGNLTKLIPTIMSQTRKYFNLAQIIVVSDNSSDNTIKLKKQFAKYPVKLILSRVRKGKPARVNQIFQIASSDMLLVLDADTKFSGRNIIDNLVYPYRKSQPFVVSGHVEPLPPTNLVEKVAYAGVSIWNSARSKVNVHSLYNCDGMIRLFSKSVYEVLRFPDYSADDSFTYFSCKNNNWLFECHKNALVYYHLPSTFSDYLSQQRRYLTAPDIMYENFSHALVESEMTIKSPQKIIALITNFLINPLYTVIYLGFSVYVRVNLYYYPEKYTSKWQILASTKKVWNQ